MRRDAQDLFCQLGEFSTDFYLAVDALPESEYPSLHACVEPLATVASDDQFEFGLGRLLQPFSDG